jgi:hypothetical protein
MKNSTKKLIILAKKLRKEWLFDRDLKLQELKKSVTPTRETFN